MGCLDDVEVLELVSGVMPAAELSRADAHLDSCEDCRSLVASVVRARRGPEAAELAPGDRVGRFVIEERRASGAMGVVFTARDPDLGRRVAIKVLRPELAGSEPRARLTREAQAMARVAHPNVVSVFEVGTLETQVFVAMELVDGVTLRAWLGERRTPAAILEVFSQAGRGLAAAHAAGLVHRDFKPDNVLVASDGRVRVTDFGLASGPLALAGEPTALADGDDLVRTRTGALLGTPAYMAPEQLAGRGADARSDQFAFAVALFEALHGERPFAGTTVAELEAAIRARRMRPERTRAPRAVSAALQKALAPDPSERHADMTPLISALQPARKSNLGRWLLALTALVCVAAAFAAQRWLGQPAPAPVCRAVTDFDAAWSDADRTRVDQAFGKAAPSFGRSSANEVITALDRWRSELEDVSTTVCAGTTRQEGPKDLALAQATCVDVALIEVRALIATLPELDREGVARAGELVLGSLPNLAACQDETLAARAPPAGTARQEAYLAREAVARSRVFVTLGDFDKAKREAEQSVRAAQASGHLPTVGAALLASAEAARAAGAAEAALELAREALFALEEGRDDRGAARAWILMMSIEGGRGAYDRAYEWAGFARAALARAGNPNSLQADLAETLANLQLANGRLYEAGPTVERALVLAVKLGEDDGARGSRVRTIKGNLHRATGLFDLALEQHRRALFIDDRRLGIEHPQNGRHHHNIAGVLKAQGKLEEAVIEYERALALKRNYGADHPEVALTLNSLGIVAQERGELEKARKLYAEAIRIYTLTSHEQRAVVEKNLATLASGAAPSASAPPTVKPSSAGKPSSTVKPSSAGKPTATARPTGEQPGYMPAPAWP